MTWACVCVLVRIKWNLLFFLFLFSGAHTHTQRQNTLEDMEAKNLMMMVKMTIVWVCVCVFDLWTLPTNLIPFKVFFYRFHVCHRNQHQHHHGLCTKQPWWWRCPRSTTRERFLQFLRKREEKKLGNWFIEEMIRKLMRRAKRTDTMFACHLHRGYNNEGGREWWWREWWWSSSSWAQARPHTLKRGPVL